MIYYFSGTGNSQYVAQRVATALGDTIQNIADNPTSVVPDNGEPLGFVTPTYFWGIPWIVTDFLQRLDISGQHYCYHILTCGGSTGNASGMLEKHLGHRLDARFSVKMVDTWTPMFDVSNPTENERILDQAEVEIDRIIQLIQNRTPGDFDRLKGLGRISTALIYPFYKRQHTRKFAITHDCNGCGLCAQQCPIHAISLSDGRPHWTVDHCLFCLGCLHRCPQQAITFGPNTHKHGQYINPRIQKI